jgi:hypothetical protein
MFSLPLFYLFCLQQIPRNICQIFEMQLPRYWKNIGKNKTLVVIFVGEWEMVWEAA